MKERGTAKAAILRVLGAAGRPLAIHELAAEIAGCSENALATRVSELHADGQVVGRIRLGEVYKEWKLATAEEAARVAERRQEERRRGERRATAAEPDAVVPSWLKVARAYAVIASEEHHAGIGCLDCGSFWTNTGYGKPWHEPGCPKDEVPC